jgi:hypothetical protein
MALSLQKTARTGPVNETDRQEAEDFALLQVASFEGDLRRAADSYF